MPKVRNLLMNFWTIQTLVDLLNLRLPYKVDIREFMWDPFVFNGLQLFELLSKATNLSSLEDLIACSPNKLQLQIQPNKLTPTKSKNLLRI